MLGILRSKVDHNTARIGALLAFQDAVELEPDHLDTRLWLAETAAKLQMYETVLDQITYVLDRDPEKFSMPVLSLIIRSGIQTQRFAESLQLIDRHGKRLPHEQLEISRAMLLASQGDIGQARSKLETVKLLPAKPGAYWVTPSKGFYCAQGALNPSAS